MAFRNVVPCSWSLLLALFCTACAGTQVPLGLYASGSVDSQTELMLFEDKTFCFTFVGGSEDMVIAGRWKPLPGKRAGLRLQQERPAKPTFPAFVTPGSGSTVVFDFHGHSMADARSPVFGFSGSKEPIPTLRPLFEPYNPAWHETYRLPSMPVESARYFYIGQQEQSPGDPSPHMQVTQYQLPAESAGGSSVLIAFDQAQAAPLFDQAAVLVKDALEVEGQSFRRQPAPSKEQMRKAHEFCLKAALTGEPPPVAEEDMEEEPEAEKPALAPLKTFRLDLRAVQDEPILSEHNAVKAAAESEDAEPEDKLERLRLAAMSQRDAADAYLAYATSLEQGFWQNSSYQRARELADLINVQVRTESHPAAEALFELYLSRVAPYLSAEQFGIAEYIAGDMLVIVSRKRDEALFDKVWQRCLGGEEGYPRLRDARLFFNLACYHAATGNKPELLRFARRALELGKPPAQFRADADFAGYLKDRDFVSLLESTSPNP